MYKEKIETVKNHIKKHPNDYQSVISLYKLNSKQSDYDRRQEEIEVLKELHRIRSEYYGESSK